jgi:membrane protease YdiL (CAAX protease family)
MLGTTVILLLSILSAHLWLQIWRRVRSGQPVLERSPRCPHPWLSIAFPAAAVYVVTLVAMQLSTAILQPDAVVEVSLREVQDSCAGSLLVTGCGLMLVTGLGQSPLADSGWTATEGRRQVREGYFAFVASFGPVFLVVLLTSVLRTEENQHPFLKLLRQSTTPETVSWLLLAAVVLAPLKEELVFRVLLQEGLARLTGPVPAMALASVLFCAVHGFPDSLALLPLALVLGSVWQQRQQVGPVLIAHALFNLTNVVIMLLDQAGE